MSNTYRIFYGGEEKGPFTFEQLRSMWSSGQLTADTQYWQEGMSDWEPIEGLGLDLAIQTVPEQPVYYREEAVRLPQHHVHHSGKVSTKAHGSGIVALGAIMCFVGVFMIFTPAGWLGGILLFIGFFVAVIGRMMS